MSIYYTKCGREFEKSTNARTTGFHIDGDEVKAYDEKCAACPFLISVKEGYGENAIHKKWECRAGSQPPNHTTEWAGGIDDKNTINIYSLNVELMAEVIDFAEAHPELSASYSIDSQADCRRTVSIACSQNKKGMAAKKELIERFFPAQEEVDVVDVCDNQPAHDSPYADLDAEQIICGDCQFYTASGTDIGSCKPYNLTVSQYRPADDCNNYNPLEGDMAIGDESEGLDLEEQFDALMVEGDAEESKPEQGSRYKPKCPFLSSIGEVEIHCTGPNARSLGIKEFDNQRDLRDKTAEHCLSGFLDCEDYRKYYADPATQDTKVCIRCCNNSWYTGLPEGYDGQEWCFCQMKQKPMKHDGPSCEWFNRHQEWPLEGPAEEINSVETVFQKLNFTCNECDFYREEKRDCNALHSDHSDDLEIEPSMPACEWFRGHKPDGSELVGPELYKYDFEEDVPEGYYGLSSEVTSDSLSDPVDEVSEQVMETMPDVAKSAAAEWTQGFDYTQLDNETAEFLHNKTMKIFEIKMRSDILIGKEFLEAHQRLANNKNGTFEKWVASLGISHKTARNYINRYEYVVNNFDEISDAENIQPSLLLEISKPSAPKELQEAVIAGDIKTHKEYIALKQKLAEAELNAKDLNKKLFEEQLKNDPKEIDGLREQLEQEQKRSEELEERLQEEKSTDQELIKSLQELKDENEELKAVLASKPIEASAVEIKEIVPEELGLTIVNGITETLHKLEDLSMADMEFLAKNYELKYYSKTSLQQLVIEAQGRLNEIMELIKD